MDWLIIRDVSLVVAGGCISLIAMLLHERFRNRKKCKSVATLVCEDINTQLTRLKIIGFAGRRARYIGVDSFTPIVFDSIGTDLSILPSVCLQKVLLFYNFAQIHNKQIKNIVSSQNGGVINRVYLRGQNLYKLGLVAKLCIEEKILHNKTRIEELKKQIAEL